MGMALNSSIFSHHQHCPILERAIERYNDKYIDSRGEKLVIQALYGAVCILGSLENLFVLITILSHRSLRNLRTSCIAHLACSDLLLCVLTAPTTLWFTLNNFWSFGNLACKLVASTQAVNTFVSVLTLTAIAWDRYLLVAFPVRWRRPNKALHCILTAVWLLSLGVGTKYFFAVGSTEYREGVWGMGIVEDALRQCNYHHPQVCVELFAATGFFSERTFTIVTVLCQYMLPLSGLLFVYCKIARQTLYGRTSSIAGRVQPRNARWRRYRKVFLVTSLVLVFGVCWLPSNLYAVLNALDVVAFDHFLFAYFHLVGMVPACVNPVLYGMLNTNIRKAVLLTLSRSRRVATNADRLRYGSVLSSAVRRDETYRARSQTVTAPRSTDTARILSVRSNPDTEVEMQPINRWPSLGHQNLTPYGT